MEPRLLDVVAVKEDLDVVEVEGVVDHGEAQTGGAVRKHSAFQRHRHWHYNGSGGLGAWGWGRAGGGVKRKLNWFSPLGGLFFFFFCVCVCVCVWLLLLLINCSSY